MTNFYRQHATFEAFQSTINSSIASYRIVIQESRAAARKPRDPQVFFSVEVRQQHSLQV